jgi:DNA-binding beta-propeller fold protein YncE
MVGLLFMFSGFILNEWFLAALFSADGNIAPAHKIAIWLVDLCLIGIGLIIIAFRRSITKEILYTITGIFIIGVGILLMEKFFPIVLHSPVTDQNRPFVRAFEIYFIATGLFVILSRRSMDFHRLLWFVLSGLFCIFLFSVYIYYRRGVLYNGFIYAGSLLGINLIGTIPERVFIFLGLFFILYPISTRLALARNRRTVAVLCAAVLTLFMGLYLSKTIFRNLPIAFAAFHLILFLLSSRMCLTRRRKLLSAAVAGMITISISANVLTDLHRVLFHDPAVTRFAKGNFNNLALDRDQKVLYAVGHGIDHVYAYNIDPLNESPRLSKTETADEAFFSYNEDAKEIYIYIRKTKQLDIIDSTSLTTKKSIPIQFPPGLREDTSMGWNKGAGCIIAAAESRQKRVDGATLVVSRDQGMVVQRIPFSPMNILSHPSKPIFYMSFFQGSRNEIIAYDLESKKIVKRTSISDRMDRMAFLESANELLVAVPTEATVLRFDGDTLAFKGKIKTSFGVRTMVVDKERNLLLTVSLVTNILDVVDLNTYQSVRHFYLAPWLRSIALDGRGNAYVSSFTSLFRVTYAS